MSEMGSCRGPASRLSCTSPPRNGNGRVDSNHSALRTLVQGMPMFALGVVVTLFSSYVAMEGAQALTKPSVVFSFTSMDMLVFSLLGLFSSSLASITFRPELPSVASFFEDVAVISFASTFASFVCIVAAVRYHWIVYLVCMVPLPPLTGKPCTLLLRCFNWILLQTQHQFRSSTAVPVMAA